MQTKDIPTLSILKFIATNPGLCSWRPGVMPNVGDAMPPGIPGKLVLSKMKSLIKQDLVDGCTCGCRGDFELTEAGWKLVHST